MIDEPGWRSGSAISARPVRGPEAIHRRSLQIFVSETAMALSWPDVSTSPSRAPCASKWSRASVSGSPVTSATRAITAAEKPGGVLMPVPTAVPPSGSSASRGREARSRSTPYATCAAYPPYSWPRVTGVASIRCVRPDFTTSAEFGRFPPQGIGQMIERRCQVGGDGGGGRDVDGGREDVVGRLGGVHVVVGMDRAPQAFGGEGGDHLVGVHVRGGARAGLEHVHREVVVPAARRDLLRRLLDRGRDVRIQHLQAPGPPTSTTRGSSTATRCAARARGRAASTST
ncbi:hypothetical protein SCALM49S_03767 [Streptomyces californicus]